MICVVPQSFTRAEVEAQCAVAIGERSAKRDERGLRRVVDGTGCGGALSRLGLIYDICERF